MHSAPFSTRKSYASLLAALLVPGLALAHPEGHVAADAWAGFMHPFTGIDHALAMIAVGLWAAQLGRAATWTLPTIFPLAMIGGALLASSAVQLPAIESMLAVSVMAFGLAVAIGVHVPVIASASLVSIFAVVHGYAHFNEAPSAAIALGYGAGFVVATVLLHLTGLAVAARFVHTTSRRSLLRIGGAAICATGAGLLMI